MAEVSRDFALATVTAILLLLRPPLIAQWTNVPNPIPQGKDGKPDLTAPAPREVGGKPDLSGIWGIDAEGFDEGLAGYLGGGELPMRLWAQALTEERGANGAAGTPTAKCLPPGIPMLVIGSIEHPFKIIQRPDLVTILYEYFGEFRQIFLDGRKPVKDPNPTWFGYSVGHWDGNSLVVDSAGFNGKIWLDTAGHPATEALRTTERFERTDYGHLILQMTIDDPLAYTKPWTVTMHMHLVTSGDLFEYVCNEDEKDAAHVR
jgi:hypothetical protein